MESAKENYAVFIDLENTGGNVNTLDNVIKTLKLRGNILVSKVYGYMERFSSLKEILLSNTFNVVPSIKYGVNQKNNLDIQLVIDALEVAYKNPLIDCFCIVSGDSDYTPLVGKLKSMGKFVLGISRSEVASSIFIKACNEFVFLESVAEQKVKVDNESMLDKKELAKTIGKIVTEKGGSDESLYLSEVKKILLRLRPDFNERDYGYNSFSTFLEDLCTEYHTFSLHGEQNSLQIKTSKPPKPNKHMDKKASIEAIKVILKDFKQEGFERVNPSIIKARVMAEYPDFDEQKLGFKKFSDLLKILEDNHIIHIVFNEAKTMLVRII